MSFSYFESAAEMDAWLVSFDKVPQPADKPNEADPARVAALKAINASLKDYLKPF